MPAVDCERPGVCLGYALVAVTSRYSPGDTPAAMFDHLLNRHPISPLSLNPALPARLTVVEERTVGPGLGQDSIRAGEIASAAAALLVAVFMLASYGLFGLIADVAVAVNVMMILGLLSFLDAIPFVQALPESADAQLLLTNPYSRPGY